MSKRINITLPPEQILAIDKVCTFMQTKSHPRVIRWLIENSLLQIRNNEISPIVKICQDAQVLNENR